MLSNSLNSSEAGPYDGEGSNKQNASKKGAGIINTPKIAFLSLMAVGGIALLFFLFSSLFVVPPSKNVEADATNGIPLDSSKAENMTIEAVVEAIKVPSIENVTKISQEPPNSQIDPVSSNMTYEIIEKKEEANQTSLEEIVVPETTESSNTNQSSGSVTYHSGGGHSSGGGSHSSKGGTRQPENHAPVAMDVSVTAIQNSKDNAITLAGTDKDDDPLTFFILSSPAHGSLSGTEPQMLYTPSSGYIGEDSFTFEVKDKEEFSQVATVSIVVESPYDFTPAFDADGSNYFDTESDSTLQLSEFTVAAWFRNSADYSQQAFIVAKGGFGSDRSEQNMNYGLWLSSGEKLRGGFESPDGENLVEGKIRLVDDQWHYAVLTYDGDTLRIFLDGSLAASGKPTSQPETTNTKPLRVGANGFAENDFFIGQIDEVRVWDRALTRSEISDQFLIGTFDTTGQVLYLPFD